MFEVIIDGIKKNKGYQKLFESGILKDGFHRAEFSIIK